MNSSFITITWNLEYGLDLGFFTLRWYSLLFALGFILGYRWMSKAFQKEGIVREKLDTLLTYTVIATVVGARLGHVFFYEWDYYKTDPILILKVWEGGLASHGAAIALIIAMYFYGRKVVKKSTLWSLDRLVITVALAGCFIRLGNWMNSEIYGHVENSAVETVFTQPTLRAVTGRFGEFFADAEMIATDQIHSTDSIDYPVYTLRVLPVSGVDEANLQFGTQSLMRYINGLDINERNALFTEGISFTADPQNQGWYSAQVYGMPRWPTQIFEALGYLLIFFILNALYNKPDYKDREGFLFGAFLILIFGFRFAIEFLKADQTAFEANMNLNMGQILSIPLVLAGLFFVFRSGYLKKGQTVK